MADIVMPRLSDTMEEGTILRWLKRDGEDVARGEELVEIETDKATMTYESDQAGILQTLAAEGATLAVGEVIARVGAGADGEPQRPAVHAPRPAGAQAPAGQTRTAAAAGAPAAARPAQERLAPAAPAGDGARVKASPLARRIARERGIELERVAGSGPGGRIVKADVERFAAAPAPSAPAPAALEGVMSAKGQARTVELSRAQQTIARRMAEARATIPDFTIGMDVDMEQCVALRGELKRITRGALAEQAPEASTPTYNDMVVKASALALREHPRVNASYRDGRLQLHSRVNVGVAVATADALIVPTIFDADSKALGEIARETRALAERVRAGTITPPELGGGTFTVSNLGMYGVQSFAAIINPPQVAILSVGALEPRAVVRDGELAARQALTLTLACDHRALYGADAAQFLARVRDLLQAPSALTL